MLYINIIILLLLFGFIPIFEIFRKKDRIIDTLSFFNFYFFIFYVIVPLILLFYKIKGVYFKNVEFSENPFLGILILVFYMILVLTYVKLKLDKKIFSIKSNNFLLKKENIAGNLIIVLLLIIMTFLIFIYCNGYGGIREALEKSSFIRMGLIKPHKFSFLKRFFSVNIIISGVCYLKIKIENKGYIKFFYSLVLAICSLFLLGGRANFIYLFMMFFVIDINTVKNKRIYIKYFILGIILFYFVEYGKRIINSIQILLQGNYIEYINAVIDYKEKINKGQGYNTFIDQFSHPVLSLFPALFFSNNNSFLIDSMSALISLIPGITELTPSISVTNTFYFLGVKESIVPPGIIGFSIYYFGIFGIVIVPLVYGIVFKYINKVFKEIILKNKYIYPFYILLSLQIGIVVYTGDIRVDLHRMSYLLFYFLILLLFSQFKKIKRKKHI